MKRLSLIRIVIPALAMCATLALQARADIMVTVGDSTEPWLGFMNWTDLDNSPADDGGGAWGVPDLVSTFDDGAGTLTLSPNTIGDPSPYWYPGGAGTPGGKSMEANLYIEDTGTYNGQTVTFEGIVLDNTFTEHATRVFVSDFAPDYSSRVDSFVDLAGPGEFSVSLATINDPTRHVQYGFQTSGPNVWPGLEEPFGSLTVTAIPEPSTALLGGLGVFLLARRMRRKHVA